MTRVPVSDVMAGSFDIAALRPRDLRPIGGGVAVPDAPVLVVEPADVLRVALAWPSTDRCRTLASAGGELALHSAEPDESAVLDVLRRRHGALATARVLCAGGLVELHRALCLMCGVAARPLDAPAIVAEARVAAAPESSRAVAMFCGLLGDLAGRSVLVASAFGGVFVGGELVPSLGDAFARSPFRRRFEASGHDLGVLRAVPTWLALPARVAA